MQPIPFTRSLKRFVKDMSSFKRTTSSRTVQVSALNSTCCVHGHYNQDVHSTVQLSALKGHPKNVLEDFMCNLHVSSKLQSCGALENLRVVG
jgi:hypothetical protein